MLRALTLDDAPAIFRIRSDAPTMQHIGRPLAVQMEDAVALIRSVLDDQASSSAVTWAITFKGVDVPIGTIGYYRLKMEHYRGEVGYALHSDHWRQGIMREALEAVVECGFSRLGFHSIEAVTDAANIASNTLLERCGFVREALFKENYFWKDEFRDSAVYSLLAPTTDPLR